MSEQIKEEYEFEQKQWLEIERKYMPVFPEDLNHLREDAEPVAQSYLSHPSEAFSLRVREVTRRDGTKKYTATLKDRGEMTDDGLARLEVEIEIDQKLYEYYSDCMPTEYKYRAKPFPGVDIDFMQNLTLCEAEDIVGWKRFIEEYGTAFVDVTDHPQASSEWRAHVEYRKTHDGQETLVPLEDLDASNISSSIIEQLKRQPVVITRIAGRSGSGKSTILREVERELHSHGIASVILSTDDYHRGKTWLENYKGGAWTEWDAPIVYDVEELAADVHRLKSGTPITKRWFNFETEEPAFGKVLAPQPVILIEGIYAGSSALQDISDLSYEMPTPFATCAGRRLLRDLRERPQFADPEKSLRYILEQAEPAYRAQPTTQ